MIAALLPALLLAVSIPRGATRVPLLTIPVSVGCHAPVTVTSLTVRHEGLGATGDIDRIYALRNGVRISRTTVFDALSREAVLRFPSWVLPPCATEVITVAVDFSPNADVSSEHRLTLPLLPFEASGTVESSASALPTRLAGGQTGSLSFEPLELSSPIRFGLQRTVARFRITASQTRAQMLEHITLTNDGSASGHDLRQLVLLSQGKRVSNRVSQLSGDTVTFTFDPPLRLERGAERLFTMRADVWGGRRRTIDFTLDSPADLVSRDASRKM